MEQEVISSLVFVFDCRLVSEANNYDHWTKKAKRKKDQQLRTFAAMRNALAGHKIRLPCTVKLIRVGPKKLDSGNIEVTFKACQDEIARQLRVDDGDATKVTWVYDQEPCGKRRYSVRVEIKSC